MKITKIEVVENSNALVFANSKVELFPVKLTLRTWFGKTIIKNAYPSDYGPTYGNDTIQYYRFFDDCGKEISDKFSRQINNWFLKRTLKN